MKKMFYLGAVIAIAAVNILVISPSKAVAAEDQGAIPCNSTWTLTGTQTTVDCLSCTRVENIGPSSDPGTCTPK